MLCCVLVFISITDKQQDKQSACSEGGTSQCISCAHSADKMQHSVALVASFEYICALKTKESHFRSNMQSLLFFPHLEERNSRLQHYIYALWLLTAAATCKVH